MNEEEVIGIIREALVDSRMRVLPKLYSNNPHYEDNLIYPKLNGPRCSPNTDQDVQNGRTPGNLWAEWDSAWTGALVDHWEIIINNDASMYKTKTAETSMELPGFPPGTEVVFFVRPVASDGVPGVWSHVGKCKV